MASTEDSPFSMTASDYRKIWGFKKISITFDQLRELWDKGLCSADTNRQVCLTTLWNKKGFLHLGDCELPLTLFHKPCLVFNIRSITVLHNNFGGPVLLSSGKEEASGQRGRSKAVLSLYFQLCVAHIPPADTQLSPVVTSPQQYAFQCTYIQQYWVLWRLLIPWATCGVYLFTLVGFNP